MFQALTALAVLACGVLLHRAGAPRWTLAALLLNPMVIYIVVNGGHNDALVGLGLLGAALAAERRRPGIAGLCLAAAIGVKAIAIIPAVAIAVWALRHSGRRASVALIAGALVPTAVTYLAFGGKKAVEPLMAASGRRSRATLWELIAQSHDVPGHRFVMQHIGVVSVTVVIVVTAAIVVALIGDRRPAGLVAGSAIAYLFAAAWVMPWYLAWALPVAALDRSTRLFRLVLAQSLLLLFAYEYHRVPRPDSLDAVLGASGTAAQLFALAGCLAFIAAIRFAWWRSPGAVNAAERVSIRTS
jgi:hypothetical protein